MTTLEHEYSQFHIQGNGKNETSRMLNFSHQHRDVLTKGTTQDAVAAAASLQQLVMNLEFPGNGGLNAMMLRSMLNSTYTTSDWEKAQKLPGMAVAGPSHQDSISQATIPPDPGGGNQQDDNCNTSDPAVTTNGKRKERSADEDAESHRCSSGTKTEEDNEDDHRKGVPPDRKRNRAAVRKYRQKKKDQRESLEVEVDLLRKETERLRAQIDAQDASAALCHIWKAEAERLQKILSAMMQLVGVDGGKISNIIAKSAAPGPVQGISSQATDVPMFPQFAKALDGNNKDVRFDQGCHPQLDPQLQALQQHSQLQALQQHHHQGNAPALPHQMPSMFAHALHPAQLNGSF